VPSRLATCQIDSPAVASTCWPSSSNVMVELLLEPCSFGSFLGANSSGKYLMTEDSGFEAPDRARRSKASRIAWLNSSSRSRFQTRCSISSAALLGSHPAGRALAALSSSKNFIRFNAAPSHHPDRTG